jgi:hypothetical protein
MGNSLKPVDVICKDKIAEPIASKDKYRICKKCGKQFSQEWDSVLGKYSSYELCEECRANASREKTTVFKIDYSPYPYQMLMHQCEARFRLIAGAIRTGKDYSMTFECVRYAFACANEDRPDTLIPKVRAWIVAPYESIATEDFNQLRRIIPRELIADYNKTTKTLITKNGCMFEVKSAYDPESLVGVGLDVVLITEAARIKDLEDVWSNLEGRLNSEHRGLDGKGGIALINSSPLGANYFYTMFKWGDNANPDKDPQWQSFRWKHWDNPANAKKGNEVQKNGKTYRQNLEIRMSHDRYRQDYLADFIIGGSLVFPDFESKSLAKLDNSLPKEERELIITEWRRPKLNYSYVIGWDPALVNDGSIVWVYEKNTARVAYIADLCGMDIELQCNEVTRLSKLYNCAPIKFARTGLGMTLDTLLTNRGANATGYDEQGKNKATLVENFAVAIRGGMVHILDDGEKITEQLKFEFKDYIREVEGSRTTYHNATRDGHDDHISAGYFVFAEEETAKKSYGYYGCLVGIGDDEE